MDTTEEKRQNRFLLPLLQKQSTQSTNPFDIAFMRTQWVSSKLSEFIIDKQIKYFKKNNKN